MTSLALQTPSSGFLMTPPQHSPRTRSAVWLLSTTCKLKRGLVIDKQEARFSCKKTGINVPVFVRAKKTNAKISHDNHESKFPMLLRRRWSEMSPARPNFKKFGDWPVTRLSRQKGHRKRSRPEYSQPLGTRTCQDPEGPTPGPNLRVIRLAFRSRAAGTCRVSERIRGFGNF